MQTIKGLRLEADIIASLHYQQRLGFNKDAEIKEARRSVNKYIFALMVALICDLVFLNVLFN